MKINLQINIPVDKKKLSESSESFEFRLDDALNSAEEVLGRDEADYYVHLSTDSLSGKRQLYAHVKQANHEYSSGTPGLVPQQRPPSLTSGLEKPKDDFDTFMKKLVQNGKKLVEAHDRIDPQIALDVLS